MSPVTHLKTLASTCESAEQENGLIQDHIVLGIKDSGLQKRLLRENNLGLEKAIEIITAAEVSRERTRNMKYETATVSLVKKKKTRINRKSRHSMNVKSVDENTSTESVQYPEKFIPNVTRKIILLLNVSRVQRTFMK
ncbi:transposon Ty3-I Gag-Pol polyprotein [Nephila pilipes]|uniref:Transposon Ty3-I Gag-Pol polyprotein n=1 Tax=Nephila pilipes TaxID=299642 RepID=A0A8X6IZB1_NEPPI|nr:transposon Ty3-I Gag-Pol polyprotein [Nephila pilipes]